MLKKLFAAALIAAIAFPALQADDREKPTKDIVETAVAAEGFEKLVAAIKAADLVDALKSEGPFTVFAPTDKAFDALGEDTLRAVLADKEKLTKILLVHVIKDKAVMAEDVLKLEGEKVNGYEIKIEDGKVCLCVGEQKVKVLKTDIKCKNGVIHVIDTVLLPQEN